MEMGAGLSVCECEHKITASARITMRVHSKTIWLRNDTTTHPIYIYMAFAWFRRTKKAAKLLQRKTRNKIYNKLNCCAPSERYPTLVAVSARVRCAGITRTLSQPLINKYVGIIIMARLQVQSGMRMQKTCILSVWRNFDTDKSGHNWAGWLRADNIN